MEWSLKEGIKKGRETPAWVERDYAELGRGETLYINTFFKLSTMRQIGMCIGPIPHDKQEEYLDKMELVGNMRDVFEHVLGHLDAAYMKYAKNKAGS